MPVSIGVSWLLAAGGVSLALLVGMKWAENGTRQARCIRRCVLKINCETEKRGGVPPPYVYADSPSDYGKMLRDTSQATEVKLLGVLVRCPPAKLPFSRRMFLWLNKHPMYSRLRK